MEQDYSAFQEPVPEGQLAQLERLARAQVEAEAEVNRCEEQLKAAQKKLADIAEKELPDLMLSLRLKEFKTIDGLPITIMDKIRASIPKAREREAFKWLRDNKFGKLIKRKISLPFAMGEDEKAKQLLETIAKLELGVEVDDKQEVHNAALVAFIKRQLEDGKELPLDVFGVFQQRVSKVG